MEGNASEETFLKTMFNTSFIVTPKGNVSTIPIHSQIQLTITCFGIIGNSIIVWVTSNLLKTSGRYNLILLLLAIADTSYLCSVCAHQEGIFGKIGFEGSLLNCRIINFVAYFSGFLSSWLVTVISFERFVCIQWPIYSYMSGKKLLTVILIVLMTFSTGMSSAIFQFSSVIKVDHSSQCVFRLNIDSNLNIAVSIFTITLHSLAPVILVIIFNVLIIKALITQNKNFKKGTINSSGDMTKTQSITRMLITVSFMFAACRSPGSLTVMTDILAKHFFKVDIFENFKYISAICYILSMIDHAVNLVVYCISSSVFRAQALNQLSCRRRVK